MRVGVLLLAALSRVQAEHNCSATMEDCRASGCCKELGYECYRAKDVYYAQCRPQTACGPDESWACPGWNTCAGADSDCSLNRCCANEGEGCFLTDTEKWHATCKPMSVGRPAGYTLLTPLGDDKELQVRGAKANVSSVMYFYTKVLGSGDSFCENTPEWRCAEHWQQRASEIKSYIDKKAELFMVEEGLSAGIIVVCDRPPRCPPTPLHPTHAARYTR